MRPADALSLERLVDRDCLQLDGAVGFVVR
jgi:hypothetical protein